MTPFDTQCEILSELWTKYKFETEFSDFIEYNDLGLPLAFALKEDLVKPTVRSKGLVNETFGLLLGILQLEDTGFESLDEMLA